MSAIDRAPRPAQRRKRQRRDISADHVPPFPQVHAVVNGICSCCQQTVPSTLGSIPNDQPISPVAHEDLLPPQDGLVDACEWFFTTYFQLGFLHKPTFMHTLITAPQSISTFLLLSMLSISARFSPRLIERYGSGAAAADVFARQAQKLAGEELAGAATLDRAQAFFLCSIWNWGSGYRDRSWIYLGVAARMASILKLSQESSYNLGPDASVEAVISAEVSRRTWWVIFMSDNLLSSGCGRPVAFDLDQVTIPLPLDEDYFSFGYQGPATVLPGTNAEARPRSLHQAPFNAPQIDPQLQSQSHPPSPGSPANPNLNEPCERSLYGNLITIAEIWARVARSALVRSQPPGTPAPPSANLAPWHPESDYIIIKELEAWEASLGPRQTWSMSNLLAYQSKNLDMGFRGIFLFMHLAHIVMRRSYLPMLAHDVQNGQSSSIRTAFNDGQSQPPPAHFWETMVHDMFAHAFKAIELVKSWVPTRPFSRGCTPMMGFSLFMAGSVLAYLRKWKWLCLSLYPYTEAAIQNALDMIADIAVIWPQMGSQWHTALTKTAAELGPPDSMSLNGQRNRGVEGLGRAAEEDLIADQREGMYRHKSMEAFEEKAKQQQEQSSPVTPASDLSGLLNRRDVELPPTGASRTRSESTSSVQNTKQTHDTHMLYSLATAARYRNLGLSKLMPSLFDVLGKVLIYGQRLCIYPSAFDSEDERTFNLSLDNPGVEDVTLITSDKVTLKCYLLRASHDRSRTSLPDLRLSIRTVTPSVVPRAIIIMFHGNGYHAWLHLSSAKRFLRLGCDVLVVSYRGYGHSSGKPSEKGLRRDSQAALEYVLADAELSKSRIVLHGHSLGGAVAIDLAGRNPDKISGLIVENTFLSIPLVAKEIPGIRHLTFIIHQRWESYKRILKIPKHIPILMLSGKEDEVVPEWHMLKLWELAGMRGEGTDVKRSGSEGEETHPNCGNDMFKSIAGGTHADTWTRFAAQMFSMAMDAYKIFRKALAFPDSAEKLVLRLKDSAKLREKYGLMLVDELDKIPENFGTSEAQRTASFFRIKEAWRGIAKLDRGKAQVVKTTLLL
ncbi:n-carbamoylsarcosine amidase [Lentinula edodes]|uniref:N-carbamoylsarcosine amidase n=1 Tax=Lentinula edodes TaxID=5353 RepID=A0A1Q3DXV0_LENED|nr:n-carbamoylsarcosine amidase [Lentinula edodes]